MKTLIVLCAIALPVSAQVLLTSTRGFPATSTGYIAQNGAESGPTFIAGRIGDTEYRSWGVFNPSVTVITSTTHISYNTISQTSGFWTRSPANDQNPLLPARPGTQPGDLYAWDWTGVFVQQTYTQTTERGDAQNIHASLDFRTLGGMTSIGDTLEVRPYSTTGTAQERFVSLGGGELLGSVSSPSEPFTLMFDLDSIPSGPTGFGFTLSGGSNGEYIFAGTGGPNQLFLEISYDQMTTTTTTFDVVPINEPPNFEYRQTAYGPAGDKYWTSSATIAPAFGLLNIPEPSTYAAISCATLIGFMLIRRKLLH